MENRLPAITQTKLQYGDIIHTPDGKKFVVETTTQYIVNCCNRVCEDNISKKFLIIILFKDLNDVKHLVGMKYDITQCTIEKAAPRATRSWSTKGLTKEKLIAYIVSQNGPMCREDILKQVAFLEGKDWKPASNQSYFTGNKLYNQPSLSKKQVLCEIGKKVNKIIYTFGPIGALHNAEVVSKIGITPAKIAKQSC